MSLSHLKDAFLEAKANAETFYFTKHWIGKQV